MSSSKDIITKEDLLLLRLPDTIDEVIAILEKIIIYCEINNSCAGYFAVLYYKVTCKVKEAITNKSFEDGIRMERLDVAFARRYIEAFYSWIVGRNLTRSWHIAFDSISQKSLIVLQHLLLGMNVHINLDLGIATALVMKGSLLDGIHNDFNMINSILASMINDIEDCLTKINPLMKLLNLNIYKYDEMLVHFSVSVARDGAWAFSGELAGKEGADFQNCILARDERIGQLGEGIAKPSGLFLKFVVYLIRLFEKKNVSAVTKLLGT